jgi:hypothetical protein
MDTSSPLMPTLAEVFKAPGQSTPLLARWQKVAASMKYLELRLRSRYRVARDTAFYFQSRGQIGDAPPKVGFHHVER